MHSYIVTNGPAKFHAGQILHLSAAQAAARSHALVRQGDAWLVTGPVEFKSGESIGLPFAADDLPGILAERLLPLAQPAQTKPAKTAKKDA